MGRGVGGKTKGPPVLASVPQPHGQLYHSPTFSPQALQLKMTMDQTGVGQGSREVQGWGQDPSPAVCVSTRFWSRCETPEAR